MFAYPARGHTYWAALAELSVEFITVYGSAWGVRVNPDVSTQGGALFNTEREAHDYRDKLSAYRVSKGCTPGLPGEVLPVVWFGGSTFKAATV